MQRLTSDNVILLSLGISALITALCTLTFGLAIHLRTSDPIVLAMPTSAVGVDSDLATRPPYWTAVVLETIPPQPTETPLPTTTPPSIDTQGFIPPGNPLSVSTPQVPPTFPPEPPVVAASPTLFLPAEESAPAFPDPGFPPPAFPPPVSSPRLSPTQAPATPTEAVANRSPTATRATQIPTRSPTPRLATTNTPTPTVGVDAGTRQTPTRTASPTATRRASATLPATPGSNGFPYPGPGSTNGGYPLPSGAYP